MKRAQAALEFLMTYGWAVLVVLAIVGALAYVGVYSSDDSVPSVCLFRYGIACQDFVVHSTEATLVLVNSLGKDITLTNVSVAGCSNTFSQGLDNGGITTLTLTGCSYGDIGSKVSGDVVLTYTSTGLTKTHTGEIRATVE